MFYIDSKKILKTIGVLSFLFYLVLPSVTNAASLSFSPSFSSSSVGDYATIKVLVNSNNVSINAISGVVYVPENIFTIESVSKNNSVLNFWVTEPVISRNTNTVKFEGVVLGGYTGSSGVVLTINVKAIKSGEGKSYFKSAQILANDGEGTDITEAMHEATFTIKEAVEKVLDKVTEVNIKEVEKPVSVKPTSVSKTTEEEVAPQPLPTLKAPEIVLGEKYGAKAIMGSSDSPKSQVLITFVAKDGTKIFITGVSDSDGSFTMLVPQSLRRGVYTTTAVVVRQDKTNSEPSNTISVNVGNVFSDITWEFWLFVILLLVSIIYLLFGIVSHLWDYRKNKGVNKKEIKEVKDIVDKSFEILREDIAEYEKGNSSEREDRRISSLKKDMDDAEKIIDKKIDNI